LVAPLDLDQPAHVQVALTFPPYPHRPGAGHIDGISGREPDGRPGTFTMLAGVALSDQTSDDMGNLFVWPGSHRVLAHHLGQHGPEALLTEDGLPRLDFGEPVQVHAAPGDLLLSHYLLSHNIGGNTSSIIRRTLYFRLKVSGHNERWREVVTDPLLEFPAVRAAE
jgi:ectoine hydroxylase-related dioxygenase (phytanoyl-CoA dioxygenase family)